MAIEKNKSENEKTKTPIQSKKLKFEWCSSEKGFMLKFEPLNLEMEDDVSFTCISLKTQIYSLPETPPPVIS